MKNVSIFFNGAYQGNPEEYPRQVDRLRKLGDRLKSYEAKPDFVPVYFRGETPEQVHRDITGQVRKNIERTAGTHKIFFGGDGFAGAMVNAVGKLKDAADEPGLKDAAGIDEHPIMVAKGGSLNLFSKHLGSDHDDALETFVREPDAVRSVQARRRQLTITKDFLGDDPLGRFSQTYPFALFAGTGTDATMVKINEEMSRARHWALNVAGATMQGVKNIWFQDGKFRLDTLVTIPYFGLMRFPKHVDTLADEAFYRLQSSGRNALETSLIMLGGHVAMSNPLTAEMFLGSGQTLYQVEKVPSVQGTTVDANCPDGLCFYTDGFPQIFPLGHGEKAAVSATTVGASGVRMASFRGQ